MTLCFELSIIPAERQNYCAVVAFFFFFLLRRSVRRSCRSSRRSSRRSIPGVCALAPVAVRSADPARLNAISEKAPRREINPDFSLMEDLLS
jgi:hypothetical protein